MEGRELQSGALTRVCLLPAEPGFGLRYALGREYQGRLVLDSIPIPATLATASNRDRCLCVEQNGVIITNVEHLNAVVYALGVDNAIAVLDRRGLWPKLFRRRALPLLEDSTAGFVDAIDTAGLAEQEAPRRPRTVQEPYELRDPKRGDCVRVEPADGLHVTCTAGYEHLGVEQATVDVEVRPEAYRDTVSRARTLMNQYARLPMGLLRVGARFAFPRYGLGTGVSVESMLVMQQGQPVGEPRYGTPGAELVRHKVMDFLGALALMGPLADCRFTVVKSSHRHDLAFLRELAVRLRPVAQVPVAG